MKYTFVHIFQNDTTGAWGMDFVSSSPLLSYTVSVEKMWTQNTCIIHDV